MNETLYRWTFNFHKVVRQQNSGVVEDFISPYSAVYLQIQNWKNHWNRSTFAKVIVKINVVQFFWLTVYIIIIIIIIIINTDWQRWIVDRCSHSNVAVDHYELWLQVTADSSRDETLQVSSVLQTQWSTLHQPHTTSSVYTTITNSQYVTVPLHLINNASEMIGPSGYRTISGNAIHMLWRSQFCCSCSHSSKNVSYIKS